jgi:hypothetical protein
MGQQAVSLVLGSLGNVFLAYIAESLSAFQHMLTKFLQELANQIPIVTSPSKALMKKLSARPAAVRRPILHAPAGPGTS